MPLEAPHDPLSRRATLAFLLTAVLVLTPSIANANPVMLNPSSLLAFCIVAFWALVVEAGVVALLLALRGAAALPVFGGYFVLNSAAYVLFIRPVRHLVHHNSQRLYDRRAVLLRNRSPRSKGRCAD